MATRKSTSLTLISDSDIWANNGNRVLPESRTNAEGESSPIVRADGWTSDYSRAGGETLSRQAFNQYFNEITSNIVEINQQGILEWHASITYNDNAIILGSDGNLYQSSIASNIGNDPTDASATGNWARLADIDNHRPTSSARRTFQNPAGNDSSSDVLNITTIANDTAITRANHAGLHIRINNATAVELTLPDPSTITGRGEGLFCTFEIQSIAGNVSLNTTTATHLNGVSNDSSVSSATGFTQLFLGANRALSIGTYQLFWSKRQWQIFGYLRASADGNRAFILNPTRQLVSQVVTEQISTTASIPLNRIPIKTDGVQIFSQSFTPKSADSILLVEGHLSIAYSGSASPVIIALFLDDDSPAIGVQVDGGGFASGSGNGASFIFRIPTSTINSRIFKVRIGKDIATNLTVNSAQFGTLLPQSVLKITEIAP